MKKIIAASAGLLLVGSMVSAAHADVTFTGDARERFLMEGNYQTNGGSAPSNMAWNKNGGENDIDYGRIRLGIDATTKGGAFMSARLILEYNQYASESGAPISPGGTNNPQVGVNGNYNNNTPLTDFAYIGIPIGPVTITAGRMPDFSSVWFRYDKRLDGIAATYATKTTSVSFMFDKMYEDFFDGYALSTDNSTFGAGTQDLDVNQWTVIAKQKFVADWSGMFYGIYQDDQRASGSWTSLKDINKNTTSGSGFQGTLHGEGPAGPVKLMGEFSFAQKDLATADSTWYASDIAPTFKNGYAQFQDAYGGVVHAKMSFGPADGTLVVGFTRDGFQADGNYGFLMMGGAMGGSNPDLPNVGSPITAINRIGANPASSGYAANTFFAGLIGDYAINNTYKLVGVLADANISGYGNAIELSGLVNIKVTDGAYINLGAGLLGKSLDNSLNYATNNPALDGVNASNWVSTHNGTDYAVFSELGIKL